MKRTFGFALVLVIICAGQGFAQNLDEEKNGGWNVFGAFQTGINVQFTDMIDDGPFIYAGSQEKSDAAYMLLKTNWANPSETFGFETGVIFKGSGITANSDGTYSIDWGIKVDNTFGWLKFLDKQLTIYGGGGEFEFGEPFKTPGPIESNLDMAGYGIILICQPLLYSEMQDLKIGASAWIKEGHTTLINEAKYIFHIAYTMNDLFAVNANFAYRQYGPKFYADEEHTSYIDQMAKDHRASIGFNFLGLSDLGLKKIALDAEIRDLGGGRTVVRDPISQWEDYQKVLKGEADPVYPLFAGLSVNWRGMDNLLSISASAKAAIRIGDTMKYIDTNQVNKTDQANINKAVWQEYAPSFSFMVDISYAINDFIIPKLGAVYVMNSPAFNDISRSLRFNEGLNTDECLKDTGGLQVRAGCELLAAQGGILELGYVINKDMSKDAVNTNINSTLDHGFYASMLIKF